MVVAKARSESSGKTPSYGKSFYAVGGKTWLSAGLRDRPRKDGPRKDGLRGLRSFLPDSSAPRIRKRALVFVLVVMCLVLSCRPAVDPVITPEPAREKVDLRRDLPEEKAEVVPIETRTLLPESTREDENRPLGPLVLRVGLATDLEQFALPCCDPRVEAVWGRGDSVLPMDRQASVSPETGIEKKAVYRLQVAALKDERQALGIAEYLRSETEYPSESIFDADTDLYRVRIGKFADRQEAESARGHLAGLGVSQAWVVSEGGELENAALRLVQGGAKHRISDRWLELRAPDDVGIPFGRTRYRGKILVFLNERGLLNVINEISLEQYLRGVVPKEMGPELYNEPEALKAQAVAARTYTLRNLGEFAGEGYDICSTPRCLVYGGMGVEHPVSDRAIEETEGQVLLYEGQPAETFYSATSGGHTENVEVIFPLKKGAYLRGVPCLEAGPTYFQGNLDVGAMFPTGLMRRLLPGSSGKAAQVFSARLEHLALLVDLSVPGDRLASLKKSEVLRFVASIFDLMLDRRMTSKRQVDTLLEPDSGWADRDRRLATFLRMSGFLEPKADRALTSDEAEELLFELALYVGALREEKSHFLKLEKGNLSVRRGAQHVSYVLPPSLATYRRRSGRTVASQLDLVPGDRLRIYWYGNAISALVQPVDSPPVELGRRAPKQKWQTFKTDAELRIAVQKRYPGFPFVDFEILERGVSGRVGKIALIGSGGERMVVEGLAVRWTLDVWDTLFQVERSKNSAGQKGWFFRGRGWGHGVGMSQAGAFGMARRGVTYREILEHYYTGVELGRLKPAPARPRFPSS